MGTHLIAQPGVGTIDVREEFERWVGLGTFDRTVALADPAVGLLRLDDVKRTAE